MFKEMILAIILGTLLGFGLTGGYFAVKKTQSNHPKAIITTPTPEIVNKSIPTNNLSPTPTEGLNNTNDQLTIDSPENESIVSNSKIPIKGSAKPQSSIIINTINKTYYTHADNAGNFNIEIEIESGPNQIQIDSIDNDDNQNTTQIIVTYSTAKI